MSYLLLKPTKVYRGLAKSEVTATVKCLRSCINTIINVVIAYKNIKKVVNTINIFSKYWM
jgi:hypothetical protein